MSSSAQSVITPMVREIMRCRPKSILDIGIGFGKWGFLCREYLESWYDRTYPNQWEIKMDGIEIWKPFIEYLPWNKTIYDKIYMGDAYKIINELPHYDLIIAGDVVEHLTKDKGIELIKKCIKKSECLLVSVPLGNWLNNVILDNNPYEKHQAIWELGDLIKLGKEELGYEIRTHIWTGFRGKGCIAVFKHKKEI